MRTVFATVTLALLLPATGVRADIALDAIAAQRLGVRTTTSIPASTLTLADQPGLVRVPNDRLDIITAPAAGLLTRLRVLEGETVAAGAALAEITGPGIVTLEAEYRDAWQAQQLSAAEFTRVEHLVEEGVIAGRRLAAAEADRAQAGGRMEAARSALRQAGTAEQRLTALESGAAPAATLVLHAIRAGTVLRQAALPGTYLDQGAPVLELGRLEQLWVETHVPLDRARGFAPGAGAWIDARPGVRLRGRVITLGRRVHEADRGMLVRVSVEDPDGELIPGQPVQVSLEQAAPSGAVLVARGALVMLGGQASVFVQRGDAYETMSVEVLAEQDDRIVLRGAIAPGDRIVIAGTSALKALDSAAAEGTP